jgi:SAM-dependent methyltransferase
MKRNGKDAMSLKAVADNLVAAAMRIMRSAKTEEDLKIRFEKVLGPLVASAGIAFDERYERGSAEAKTVLKGKRPDALHGQVVIEYEPPHAFKSKRAIEHAYEQLKQYIEAEAKGAGKDQIAGPAGIVGVGFDGSSIFFVRCRSKGKTAKGKPAGFEFTMDGPCTFEPESALTFVTYLRALARLALTAENLADRFGPKADVAREAVGAFADAMANWSTPRAKVFFREWQRLFGIVYGEQFGAGSDKKTVVLAETYGLPSETDFQAVLFCVHTYFALLMKLIAAELLSVSEGSLGSSFSSSLAHASREQLLGHLTDIEDGGIYSKRGISNFLEGDFFRWYLEAFNSPRLEDATRSVTRVLSEFEPATTMIDPEVTRDLLKKLYQYLVPDVVRHHLGEYYTPDWLAELVLDEAGYRGDTRKRVLDPACGSGTFLVLVIQRAREFGARKSEPAVETVKRILANVWGFDLNPLAVIAARTNYLFALGDLTKKLGAFEIPVYLADSVLWPKPTGQMMLVGNGAVEVRTSLKEPFFVPKIWVDGRGHLMRHAAPVIEQLVRLKCTTAEALVRFKKEGLVFPPHEKVVAKFYEHVLELERDGRNGIWARFLKNVFAPMTAEKFDFVIGNPPWIRWEYLSSEYRKALTPLLKQYGLYQTKDFASRNLGVGVKDFSMLFTYAVVDNYLRSGGKLGFLITQEVFKAKGAGEGFRKFRWGERDNMRVLKALDFVHIKPFEGAANKSAGIILKRGEQTKYPVPYVRWRRKSGIGAVPTNYSLHKVKVLTERENLVARPISLPNGPWRTVSQKKEVFGKVGGTSQYKAWRGIETDPYGVYLLDVLEVLSGGDLIVRNRPDLGKRKVQEVKEKIENTLVFPALRGRDINRWGVKPEIYVVFPVDAVEKRPYSEVMMKEKWPRTCGYLTRFKTALKNRQSKAAKMLAERTVFYVMLGYGPYTISNFKVVWKRMSDDVFASVVSHHKTPYGYKTLIPLGTTAFFSPESEGEAHYLCALINSMPVREHIKSYSSAGRGFGTPSVMEHVGIPKFDEKNSLHKKLSELSKSLHRLKAKGETAAMEDLEEDVDRSVIELFRIEEPQTFHK